MAQTKKKRSTKHRGNAAGIVEARGRTGSKPSGGDHKDAKVAKPLPLYWVYVTAWATPDGVVQFRDDIYNRDGSVRPGRFPGQGGIPTISCINIGPVPQALGHCRAMWYPASTLSTAIRDRPRRL